LPDRRTGIVKMKIGVVGHRRNIQRVEEVAAACYPDIETSAIVMDRKEQIPRTVQYLQAQETHYDGLIFTGKIPYDLLNRVMHSRKPWVYLEQNQSQFQRTLLEGVVHNRLDIRSLSIDSYTRERVEQAYGEIGVSSGELELCIADISIHDPRFLEKLQDFHRGNILEKRAGCCITGIAGVYEVLQGEGIPVMLLKPTVDSIRDAVQHLILKMESRISEESRIVVIACEMDPPHDYSLVGEDEFQMMLEKTRVTEEVYRFAQRIQAAVFEFEERGYYLFSTKNIVEDETGHLKTLSLLDNLARRGLSPVSMGIGYGETAREARLNARKGILRSRKEGGARAFAVDGGRFIGPIAAGAAGKREKKMIDGRYNQIANRTKLSINTIFKIKCLMDEAGTDSFTSSELADRFGCSHRTMNRMLEKLEGAGCAEVIGSKMIGGAGRPSRIIRLILDM